MPRSLRQQNKRLQAMMQGESMKLDKGKKLKSEFGAVDEGLLDALKAEPDDRTDDHLKLIEKHCAWHPIFKDIKPMLRRKMFRYLRAKFFKFGEVIVSASLASARAMRFSRASCSRVNFVG